LSQPSDLPELLSLYSEENCFPLPNPSPDTIKEMLSDKMLCAAHFGAVGEYPQMGYVALDDDGNIIGHSQLLNFGHFTNLSYLVEKSYRRQGVAVNLIKTILGNHKDVTFLANPEANNNPSCRLLEKMGFKLLMEWEGQRYYVANIKGQC
jgi:RimJ/RimL family protein N-acetyltransferase